MPSRKPNVSTNWTRYKRRTRATYYKSRLTPAQINRRRSKAADAKYAARCGPVTIYFVDPATLKT